MTGVAGRPDAVVVQGDTTTSTAAAIAAFYHGIPVVHVEAGLRSGDLRSPFPEEANRKITSQIASLHLAPTSVSKGNLVAEGIRPCSPACIRQSPAPPPLTFACTHSRTPLGDPLFF